MNELQPRPRRRPTHVLVAAVALMGLGATSPAPAQPAAGGVKIVVSQRDQAEMVLIPDDGPVELGIERSRLRRLAQSLRATVESFFLTELPKRKVEVKAFYIDRFEVTNAEYARFLAANPQQRRPKYWSYPQYNAPALPVVGVGWKDAEAYARWAGKRLPTEEEWEKAARGKDGRDWPWGNTPDDEAYNGHAQGRFLPVAVGSFPKGNSPYGVADMAGNVWEMTSGRWDSESPTMRGGSFLNPVSQVRTTVRWAPRAAAEQEGAPWLGFRCVVDEEAARTLTRPK
jgi:formylglycine-generating enzyme required for sulfatase activity